MGSEREASRARLQANSRSERDLFWKGGARKRANDAFLCPLHKKASKQSGLCSDVSKDYKKDILAILADGVELLHETRQLQKIRRTTPVNSTLKNI